MFIKKVKTTLTFKCKKCDKIKKKVLFIIFFTDKKKLNV